MEKRKREKGGNEKALTAAPSPAPSKRVQRRKKLEKARTNSRREGSFNGARCASSQDSTQGKRLRRGEKEPRTGRTKGNPGERVRDANNLARALGIRSEGRRKKVRQEADSPKTNFSKCYPLCRGPAMASRAPFLQKKKKQGLGKGKEGRGVISIASKPTPKGKMKVRPPQGGKRGGELVPEEEEYEQGEKNCLSKRDVSFPGSLIAIP